MTAAQCGQEPSYTGDGTSTNIFATITVNGACGGTAYVVGTLQAFPYNPGKNNGKAGPLVGDPINSSTGNKYSEESDYLGDQWLSFSRFYNSSLATNSTAVGNQWRHSFDRALAISVSPVTSITAFRPDGKYETFTKKNGVWATDPDINDVLIETDNAQGVATSYTVFIAASRQYENYATTGRLQTVTDETGQGITLSYSTSSTPSTVAPAVGLLLTVTDPEGRQLNFTYTSLGQINQVTQPDGGKLTYAYDASTGNLLSVQYPDGKTRQYVYNESSLTGEATSTLRRSPTTATERPTCSTHWVPASRWDIRRVRPV